MTQAATLRYKSTCCAYFSEALNKKAEHEAKVAKSTKPHTILLRLPNHAWGFAEPVSLQEEEEKP